MSDNSKIEWKPGIQHPSIILQSLRLRPSLSARLLPFLFRCPLRFQRLKFCARDIAFEHIVEIRLVITVTSVRSYSHRPRPDSITTQLFRQPKLRNLLPVSKLRPG